MPSRFIFRQGFNFVKLKLFEKTEWVAGNSSALMERLTQFIDASMTTGGSTYSAGRAAVDAAHALEDYSCGDYPCLSLDCIASGCDLVATVVSFLPKNKVTIVTFAGCTATSQFSRTLRNECKKIQGGLFGCKKD